MMKNTTFGAYNLSAQEFYLDVVYENTIDNGTITNYLSEPSEPNIHGVPIIRSSWLRPIKSTARS